MTEKTKPELKGTFQNTCLVGNKPDGKGIEVIAFGKDGKIIATGDDFKKSGLLYDSFAENMLDLLGSGGKAKGDSYAAGRGQYDATYKEGGLAINVAKGICDVSTVDRGGVPEGTTRLGVTLKDVPFKVSPSP